MGQRFVRENLIRLERLMHMMYRPSEIAEEVALSVDTIYRNHLASGAPFIRDENGDLWIHGVSYAAWVREVHGKRRTVSLGDGEGYCMRCRKAVLMARPGPYFSNRYLVLFQGLCPVCGAKVNRGYAASGAARVARTERRGRVGKGPTAQLVADERLINRENWGDVKLYLRYLEKVGKAAVTVKRVRGLLRHFLEWAGAVPFVRARGIDPSFGVYLHGARNDGKSIPLGAVSMAKACDYARSFLEWIRDEHAARYKGLSASFIKTVRPDASTGLQSEFKEHAFWELEDVRRVAALEPQNLTEERDRAAFVFMFLSAMRAKAFVSLPVGAVRLAQHKVDQFPRLGVMTKNSKAARTDMLRLGDLERIVQAWDAKVRAAGCELWYPRIDRWRRFMAKERGLDYESRKAILNQGIRGLCDRAGVPYLSSHKLRHGHAVYAMRRVKDMKGLKILSQNLMHRSVATTDGIYAPLVGDDAANLYEGMAE